MANNDFLSNQLIKLGDMMGDGLHNDPGGKWISREYKRICKILHPEFFPKKDTSKRDESVALWCSSHKCQLCGGDLKQTRKGSIRVICVKCNQRFQLKHKSK